MGLNNQEWLICHKTRPNQNTPTFWENKFCTLTKQKQISKKKIIKIIIPTEDDQLIRLKCLGTQLWVTSLSSGPWYKKTCKKAQEKA